MLTLNRYLPTWMREKHCGNYKTGKGRNECITLQIHFTIMCIVQDIQMHYPKSYANQLLMMFYQESRMLASILEGDQVAAFIHRIENVLDAYFCDICGSDICL